MSVLNKKFIVIFQVQIQWTKSMKLIYKARRLKFYPLKNPPKKNKEGEPLSAEGDDEQQVSLSDLAHASLENAPASVEPEHLENENMSSFILIEKARLKRSQQILKQKEIIDLYQKNSHVDVEQIKGSNTNLAQAKEAGVLINKKQY